MAENNKIQNFESSGNIIVDQVGQMGITGNIVNPNWNYYVTNESGKTNYLAVQILAEIVYWYRPSIKENKTTGISEFEKRFKHDKYLQRSYYQLEENYNCSKKQAQDEELKKAKRDTGAKLNVAERKLAAAEYDLEILSKISDKIKEMANIKADIRYRGLSDVDIHAITYSDRVAEKNYFTGIDMEEAAKVLNKRKFG